VYSGDNKEEKMEAGGESGGEASEGELEGARSCVSTP
jgi:hypothetical protein